VPSVADINSLADNVVKTYAEFTEVSTTERLHFELLGAGLDAADGARLLELSSQTGRRLAQLAASQENLRAGIEEYQGSDWEKRYGSTGTWRKLKADICRARMFECETKYWAAMATGGSRKETILKDAAAEMAALGKEFESRELRLLQARVLCAAAKEGSVQLRDGMAILDELCAGSERDRTFFTAHLARWQVGTRDMAGLEQAWKELQVSKAADEELSIRMGFAGWLAGKQGWLQETIKKYPQSRAFIGKCVLAEAQKRLAKDGAEWIGAYAAALAAEAALQDVERYRGVIDALGKVTAYRGASVLQAMSLAVADKEPMKAAALLVEASKQMDGQDAVQTAEQAARLGYGEFAKDKDQCKKAREAIANYMGIAAENSTAEMRYCYYLVTNQCGDANDARRTLEKIAQGKSGEYQKKAGYELGMIRAGEFLKVGRVEEAAKDLAAGLEGRKGENADIAMDVVAAFLERQEEYEGKDGYEGLLKNCDWLAKYCGQWMDGVDKNAAGMMVGEIAALMNAKGETLDAAEKLADADRSDEAMRCRARVLMAKGQFEEAGVQWGNLCQRKIVESKEDTRSWQWWRAKYYQILCWSKGKDATKEELARRIAVIRSSCGPVPELWDKKLKAM
jgi:hypothetical protein